MVWNSLIRRTKLLASEGLEKQKQNRRYLMEMRKEDLLLPYWMEAGLAGNLAGGIEGHGGWDHPLSQIRGTFTGHWLSAAARLSEETKDRELRARAEEIVEEIAVCQKRNGGGWAFPIPEKYLYGIRKGQHFWAPQYVCHKVMMGLMDMYLFAESETALDIVRGCAEWFSGFVQGMTRETMEAMMDLEETGGMMEVWADLYAITGEEKHRALMEFYERKHLTEPLLAGKDVLTNMHANTTAAEILGCARAYEVTGEKRYLDIVQAYWEQAVTMRGMFATGGQTDGEVWTAPGRQAARRSRRNQEHCVVYHMCRLADALFRFTGEVKYLDYIELNRENGLFAQGFWTKRRPEAADDRSTDVGLIAYYLPLAAGVKKTWGSRKNDFWCCHGTLVQANVRYREYIFYEKQSEEGKKVEPKVVVAQYQPAKTIVEWNGTLVTLTLSWEDISGKTIPILESALQHPARPDFLGVVLSVKAEQPVYGTISLRIPWWKKAEPRLWKNGRPAALGAEEERDQEPGFWSVSGIWQDDEICLEIPKGLTGWPLADEPDTVAFLDGPVLLAGLVAEERELCGEKEHPETMLAPAHERQWENWTGDYRTIGQKANFNLKPLKEIGKDVYTVYFPVRKRE